MKGQQYGEDDNIDHQPTTLPSTEESDPEVDQQQQKKETAVLWAKMAGFHPWPARYCSAKEELDLRRVKKGPAQCEAVYFFGVKHEKGWVPSTSICYFNKETWGHKFLERVAATDVNYRAAVWEALSLVDANSFGRPIGQFFRDLEKNEAIHVHCFGFYDLNVADKGYVCESCCRRNKWPEDTFYDYRSPGDENQEQQTSEMTKSGSTSKNNNGRTNGSSAKKEKHKDRKEKDSATESQKKRRLSAGGVNNRNGDGSPLPIAVVDNAVNDSIKKEGAKSSRNSQDGKRGNGEDPILAATPIPESSNTSSTSFRLKDIVAIVAKENLANQSKTEMSEDVMEENSEDNCQVCGLGGELLLCDYPHCRKVYHRICLAKILPFDLLSPEFTYELMTATWFCPRHYCLSCGALEKENHTSTSASKLLCSNLPSALYRFAEIKADRERGIIGHRPANNTSIPHNPSSLRTVLQSIELKPLLQCTTCALSENQCFNCMNPTTEQRKAKILEQAFVKVATSRLALPFLRPLLPLYVPGNAPTVLDASTSSSKGHITDLLGVVEKIHSGLYASPEGLIDDIEGLRPQLDEKLYQYLAVVIHGDRSSLSKLPEYQDVLMAFNTLINHLKGNLVHSDFAVQLMDAFQSDGNVEQSSGRGKSSTKRSYGNAMEGSSRGRRSSKRGRPRSRGCQDDKEEFDDAEQDSCLIENEEEKDRGIKVIRKLWRLECHYHPWHAKNASIVEYLQDENGLINSGDTVVPARSLNSWLASIRNGAKDDKPLIDDPETAKVMYNGSTKIAQDQQAKSNAVRFLANCDDTSAEMNRLMLAKLMLGMQHSALRETTSLPADFAEVDFDPYITMSGSGEMLDSAVKDEKLQEFYSVGLNAVQNSRPIEDETLVMIERLGEITQHALTLQAKLRADHLRKQREILVANQETLTIGEAGLLAELKLANDVLRSQLQHRNHVIHEQQYMIQQRM
eukprot:scaffold300_cov173-Ochromonas_danica.AAC.8